MTAPTNVAVNEMSNSPDLGLPAGADEEAITGFRIYLNGTLQWVEDAEHAGASLPPEWFNPPCGSTYTFAVTAYRFDLPDGPESPPGEAAITSPLRERAAGARLRSTSPPWKPMTWAVTGTTRTAAGM